MKKILAVLLSALMIFAVLVPTVAAEEKKLSFLSLGDSIAAGAGLADPDTMTYGAIVSHTNGYNFKNDAVNGHQTKNLLKRVQTASVREDIANADIICISIGGNDFIQSDIMSLIKQAVIDNDYSQFDKIAATAKYNLGLIINEIKGVNPNATILMQTLYNPMYLSKEVREAYQQGLNRLNGAIRSYLDAHPGAYTIVDVEPAFSGDSSLIAPDTIHPNPKGHRLIAKTVLGVLKELGLGEQTEISLPNKFQAKLVEIFQKVLNNFKELISKLFKFAK